MLTKTKIVLAAALALGTASAVHAPQNKIYPGIIVRPSPNVDRNPATKPTGAVRSLTPFERNWFDYQNHDDQ